MARQIGPVLALLMGSAFLMLAGGVNGMILPLHGARENFSSFSLGLLGTGWSIGYILGCLWTPRLVARVGHVRCFGVMAAVATVSVLGSVLFIHPTPWIILRGTTGFAFAGAAMIVESWLSERSDPAHRGRIFGLYAMVNLAAITVGQMMVAVETGAAELFVVAAMFYVLALVPTALSTVAQPRPLHVTQLDIGRLFRNSPIAVVGAFLIGLSNSTFGTLGVVYGQAIGLGTTAVALMMSLAILAGAAFQVPVGFLSDRTDRRWVLIGVVGLALAADLFFVLIPATSAWVVLPVAALFGGAIYSVYPVLVAHAYDQAEPGDFLRISGGLLLTYGLGGVIGPLVAGWAMALAPALGMFGTTGVAHGAIIAYALWRISRRRAVSEERKTDFVNMPATRMSTPATSTLDPRLGKSWTTPVREAAE